MLCADLSLVAASRGYSLPAVHELLLIAVASLVAEHGLQGVWSQQLWPAGSAGSVGFSVAHRLSCLITCVQSSRIRDQTHVHCIGRKILNPWFTREVPRLLHFNPELCDYPQKGKRKMYKLMTIWHYNIMILFLR